MNIDLQEVFNFIRELEKEKIFYRIRANIHDLGDALCLEIMVPGEIWEVDFLDDGTVDVEIFKSDGEIYGLEKVDQLLRIWSS